MPVLVAAEGIKGVVDDVGTVVDVAGVVVMVVGMAIFVAQGLAAAVRGGDRTEAYESVRHGIGRSILLGLEILIVGDIIRTVAVEPTFESVGVLAVIVLIRTFLSITLELEISGRWPWQPEPNTSAESRPA